MSRIPTIASIETAPAGSQPLLTKVKGVFGTVPAMFRVFANSPAALEGYLSFNGALAKGTLGGATGERIALAVANVNHCGYCNSAHTALGKLQKLDESELAANRLGRSNDAKADAAVKFAKLVAQNRGQVSEGDLAAVKAAGFTDGELVEIVAHVVLNTLTNYVNEVFKTEIDFPRVELAKAA